MTKNETVEVYYRENYGKLVKMARNRVGDYSLVLAEEAVQEAFTRSLKYFRSYDKNLSFDIWFKRILYNAINNLKRLEKDGGAVYNDEEAEKVEPHISVTFTQEVVDILNQCSVRDQEILNMYCFYGFKSREVGEMLNVSHDVVRDVIRRFREKLRN